MPLRRGGQGASWPFVPRSMTCPITQTSMPRAPRSTEQPNPAPHLAPRVPGALELGVGLGCRGQDTQRRGQAVDPGQHILHQPGLLPGRHGEGAVFDRQRARLAELPSPQQVGGVVFQSVEPRRVGACIGKGKGRCHAALSARLHPCAHTLLAHTFRPGRTSPPSATPILGSATRFSGFETARPAAARVIPLPTARARTLA